MIRLGSRNSELARAQAELFARAIREHSPNTEIRRFYFVTSGDRIKGRLDGGKGLFVKELDEAVLRGEIDAAVHSLKDIPYRMPSNLTITACLPREDPRDALVLPEGASDLDLSKPIGTSSPRRALQIKKLYPNAEIKPVRGNVFTRLQKLDSGEYGALILAAAGLKRLGLAARASRVFAGAEMLPAAGQGIIAGVTSAEREVSEVRAVNDDAAMRCAIAERSFVSAMGADCGSPIGAYARITGGKITLTGMIEREGQPSYAAVEGNAEECALLGKRLYAKLAEKI